MSVSNDGCLPETDPDSPSARPLAGGGRGVPSYIFEELDQITPSVTDQLQAFCSLAVHQMKQYPLMMQTLQTNLNKLTEAVTSMRSRIETLESKEGSDFASLNDENRVMKAGLQQVVDELGRVAQWKCLHEEEIRQGRQEGLRRSQKAISKIDEVDQTFREFQREAGRRMDVADQTACANAEIRDKIHDQMKTLQQNFEQYSEAELHKRLAQQTKIEEHEARCILLEETAESHTTKLNDTQSALERLDGRCGSLENSIELLRVDMTSLERDLTKSENRLHELEDFRDNMKRKAENLGTRITDLETDGRIERLEGLFPRVESSEKLIQEHEKENKENEGCLRSMIRRLEEQAAAVHPVVWKLQTEVEQTQEEGSALSVSVEKLLQDVEETRCFARQCADSIETAQLTTKQLQTEIQTIQEDKRADGRRVQTMVEDAIARSAPRAYEIEDIRRNVASLRTELLAEIEESKNIVKFDLLHDPSPQVDRLKDYLQQQEEVQSKLKKRLLVLEEGLKAQMALLSRADQQMSDTMERLSGVDSVREDVADIPKMKQRIQQLSQSAQTVQEQLLSLRKQQGPETQDRSFSRCSSMRSSVMLNPAALAVMNKRGSKTMRKRFFGDHEQPQTPKIPLSPPKTADTSLLEAAPEQRQSTSPSTPPEAKEQENRENTKNAYPHQKCEPKLLDVTQQLGTFLTAHLPLPSDERLCGGLFDADMVQQLLDPNSQSPFNGVIGCLIILVSHFKV